MCKKTSLLIFIGLILSLSTSTSAICFDTIASYEPVEVSDLNVSPNPAFSPTLDVNWPVRGGVNDVPEATEGDYVLKLSWTNEVDRKIEIRHHWNESSFDLKDVTYVLANVYFATESALPDAAKKNISIWTVWDSNEHWISCEHVPPMTGEWYTVVFYVGNLNYTDLNDITALTFEDMGDPNDPNHNAGVIYIDNLQLATESPLYPYQSPYFGRKIKFSGYEWLTLQSEWPIGVGPNRFTDEPNDVWIDPNGHLHLRVVYKDPNWYCSEVVCNENLGYGTYVFTAKAREDLQDPNIVLGLFIYDVPDANGDPREIDFELTRWSDPCEPNNAQYVVQPDKPENKYRFHIDEHNTTTHVWSWEPDRICFWSYYGDFSEEPLEDDIIACWCYTGGDNPKPGCENPRINFWLRWGDPPSNGQNSETVIKSFQYLPYSIVSPCCPLLVKAPHGGENWVVGTTQNIEWEASTYANIAQVKIELSINNGQDWNDVNVVANTGSYQWLVPEVTSNQCLVRISDANDANIYDISDDMFTIFVCTVPITGDVTGDCYLNFKDFAILAANWLKCGNPFDPGCYHWLAYDGHHYAVTRNYSNWADAEAEAVALGGHLVTINDANENTWLCSNFSGYYTQGHHGNTWASLIWIGLEYIGGDKNDPNSWQWVSGEPRTYMAPWWSGSPTPNGVHAYLHTNTHPNPCTWWDGPQHDIDPPEYPRGIIEVPW